MSATDVYVINLCASMTPMPSVPRSLKGYENHRLYQLNRVEDGRHRYRLRLGFFNSEADAEIALASLRSMYPAAFTSRAGAEDMRYNGDPLITGRFEARPTNTPSEAKPPVQGPVAASPAQTKPAAPVVVKPAAPAQSAPTVAAAKQPAPKVEPIVNATPKPGIESAKPAAAMSLLDPPAAVESTKERNTPFTMTAHQPFHVARGVNLPDTDLELAPTLVPSPPKFVDPQWVHLQSPLNKAAATPPAAKPKSAAPSLPIGKPVAKATAPAKPAASAVTSTPVPAVKSPAPAVPVIAAKSAPPVPQKSAPIATPAAAQTPAQAPAPKIAASAPVAKPAPAQPAVPVIAKAEPPKPAAKNSDDYVPILDTTMTIRTISVAEMEDANQPKWFSVQLAVSEQSFNLDAMPRLDIFAAYRVYSVAMNCEDGKLKHSLRLGFFKEEVSADAVAGYLKTFFPAPTITRVGVAEYERFIEPKTPEPAAESKVVNLVERREAGTAPSTPTFGVTPAPSPVRAKPQKSQKPQKPKW
ncbi:MAG TPA: hypothetical protein VHL14_10530, partial [Steroidobacteraceae bacterium]|nr:hypothetical protein [Steroidobacteraceae bacterium]